MVTLSIFFRTSAPSIISFYCGTDYLLGNNSAYALLTKHEAEMASFACVFIG